MADIIAMEFNSSTKGNREVMKVEGKDSIEKILKLAGFSKFFHRSSEKTFIMPLAPVPRSTVIRAISRKASLLQRRVCPFCLNRIWYFL
jgi:hypothetical protein